jgi:hypothetical protein
MSSPHLHPERYPVVAPGNRAGGGMDLNSGSELPAHGGRHAEVPTPRFEELVARESGSGIPVDTWTERALSARYSHC